MNITLEQTAEVILRLQRIESALDQLLKKQAVKGFYTVEEFAAIVGKAPFTCREWLRLGRLKGGRKRQSGRGSHLEWIIPHESLLFYQEHGLLRQPGTRLSEGGG